MTAEEVFHLYRSYKFFYSGDQPKFGVLRHPPLLKQYDRQFYYRIANKMGDLQIHALFQAGFFYRPTAHVSDLVTPAACAGALTFAGRHEGGRTLMEHDIYALQKMLAGTDIHVWLYDNAIPECLQQVISGEIPPDLGCVILLVPKPHLDYNWPAYWATRPDYGLGCSVWIDRLNKLDQLLYARRPLWRLMMHECAHQFWFDLGVSTLAPRQLTPSSDLF